MSRRSIKVVCLSLGLACLLLAGWQQRARTARGFFGPLTGLVASIHWVQFDRQVTKGAWEEAYGQARTALAWDPESPEGWSTLASHLIFLRASELNEPTLEGRAVWMQLGLRVLQSGEERSRAPGVMAFESGLVRIGWILPQSMGLDPLDSPDQDVEEHPPQGPILPWPGGPQALWRAGVRAFLRAHAFGHPDAEWALQGARDLGEKHGWIESE